VKFKSGMANRWKFGLTVSIGVLLLWFNNCAPRHETINSNGIIISSSGGVCDENRLREFSKTVWPFLSRQTTCANCHIEGGVGLGTFASKDLNSSFNAFSATGLSKISFMATNASHKAPYTGDHLKADVNTINVVWPKVENDYLDCLSRSGAGGVNESILTSAKPAPGILNIRDINNPPTQKLTWDLELGADLDETSLRTAPAKISIEIKPLFEVENGRIKRTTGYVFSNPTIQMKDSTTQLIVEVLYIYINKKLVSNNTAFTTVSRVVQGTSEQSLLVGSGPTLIDPVTSTDTFSIYIQRVVRGDEVDSASAPPIPILSMNDAFGTRSTTLVSANGGNPRAQVKITRDPGVTRWCLTTGTVRPINTEAPCEGGTGPLNGWFVSRPNESSVPTPDGVKNFNLWVANAYLKLSSTPATYSITLDTTAPAAPSISSSGQYPGIQIAQLSIGATADEAGWCVHDQNSLDGESSTIGVIPSINNDCWNWGLRGTKPTNVGFNGRGTRYVWVWVRDAAGNISPASNRLTFNNPLNPVTFSQLIGPDSDGAVFTRHCAACHQGSNNPGYQQLQLFNFVSVMSNETTARLGDNSIIIQRTNDSINPMPNVNSGLMDVRYRNLIRLWVSPRNEFRVQNQPPM
jgi:hypothetical protein